MSPDLNALLSLIGQSFADPAGVARLLNALRLNRGILWSSFLVVICLSTLLLVAAVAIAPTAGSQLNSAGVTPFTLAMMLGGTLVMLIFAMYFTGQMFGGTGRFPGALLLVTWWQVLAMAIQVIQIVVELTLPALSGILALLGGAYLFYALVHFVNVLHGFDNLFKALGTIVFAFLAISFGLALLATLIGVTAAQGGLT